MATLRSHVIIDRSADDVWKIVSDAGNISDWFPLVTQSELTAETTRHVVLEGGVNLTESIVTNDATLRRFQYRIVDGDLPVTHHIATIDVIDLGGRSLVIYGTDVEPDDLADTVAGALEGAVHGLAASLR